MTDLRYEPLDTLRQPLVNRFYRSHRSPSRARGDQQAWVARAADPVAALCLTPLAGGHWLTGLLVDPAFRQRGVGSELMRRVRDTLPGPVWLFCHPDLDAFYQPLGYRHADALPAPLAERLARYRRHKPLLALVSQPLPAAETPVSHP